MALEGENLREYVEVAVVVQNTQAACCGGGRDDEIRHGDGSMKERMTMGQLPKRVSRSHENGAGYRDLRECVQTGDSPVEIRAITGAVEKLERHHLTGRDSSRTKRIGPRPPDKVGARPRGCIGKDPSGHPWGTTHGRDCLQAN